MDYREKIKKESEKLELNSYTNFCTNLYLRQFSPYKKNEVLGFCLRDAEKSLNALTGILPVHEKKLKKILELCKKDSLYRKYCLEDKKNHCGDLWAIEKTIKEKKVAINSYRKYIQIVEAEMK